MAAFRSFSVALENKNKKKNRNKMQSGDGDLQSNAAVVVNDVGAGAETSEGLAWWSAVESGPELKVRFTRRCRPDCGSFYCGGECAGDVGGATVV
jgi:hypothetical protein